jgi:Zn-finger in ubiquitin-hydrolases and other protein
MTDRMSKRVGRMPQDHGQTFSTQCARTSRGSSSPILGRLGQQANHRNEQVRLAATTQFRYLPPLSERHEAGRRDACRSRWRVTLTAPVRCESRRMWLAASNTNLTPLVTGPVIQLSQRHARSVAADELGLLIRDVAPSSTGCQPCLDLGDTWVHLRMCMTDGQVLCCDSSKNRHASRHAREQAPGHQIVRSMQPGEDWLWCYADQTLLEAPRAQAGPMA